jgi:hypothetical protein
MRRILMALIPAAVMTFGAVAFAADAAAKPDCADKQKPDLSSCKDMKGKDKSDCEKPLKDKAKADSKTAKDNTKGAKMALDCCKNPKKKGCAQ